MRSLYDFSHLIITVSYNCRVFTILKVCWRIECYYSLFFYRPSPFPFFCGTLPSPTFCVPSQLVSWSAQPLEPPSETYVSALHDMWSTKARKVSMALPDGFPQLLFGRCGIVHGCWVWGYRRFKGNNNNSMPIIILPF